MIIRRLSFAVITIGALVLIFLVTNPGRLPVAVFILVFGLLYVASFLLIDISCLMLDRLQLMDFSAKRISRVAALVAILPVFLLVLQSIGQLTFRDVLLIMSLFVLLYAYFNRVAAKNI